jgi:hypothetical protein
MGWIQVQETLTVLVLVFRVQAVNGVERLNGWDFIQERMMLSSELVARLVHVQLGH